MNLTNKYWLLGLWFLPLLAFLFRFAAVKVRVGRQRFAEPEMVRRLAPARSATRETVRALLVLVGLAFFFVAAAGPRGEGETLSVERKGADILVLLDVSRSMLSNDIAPNRLESAKLDINDLLQRVAGDRVGLIAFAGRPTIKIPLTNDYAFFRDSLNLLSVADATRGGTAIGEAIRLALRCVDPESPRDLALVLITDGEDHESDPLEAADEAASLGVKIFTVALGDAEQGGRIPLYDGRGRLTGYQKYKGKEIWTRADRELLTEIAQKTGGAFLDMGTTPTDLGAFYQQSMRLKRSGYGERERRVWNEKFQPYLLVGCLLVWAGFFLSPLRNRREVAAMLVLAAAAVFFPTEKNLFAAGEPNTESGAEIDFFNRTPEAPDANTSLNETPEKNDAGKNISADSPDSVPTGPAAVGSDGSTLVPIDPLLTAEELYNKACELAARGEEEQAMACLEEGLARTDDRQGRLRGKLRYNLAIIRARALERKSSQPEESEAEEKENNVVPPMPSVVSGAVAPADAAPPNDVPAEYRADAARRAAAFADLEREADLVFHTFREAAAESKGHLHENARRASDLVLSWTQGKRAEFLKKERQVREKLFAPTDHLRWLREELTDTSERKSLNVPPTRSDEWQSLYRLGEELAERATDLESLLEQGTFCGEGEGAQGAEDAAARLEELERGLTSLTAASDAVASSPESALESVREALGAIDRAEISYGDYQTIVQDALARQEEIVKQTESLTRPEIESDSEESENDSKNAKADPHVVTRETLLARGSAIPRRVERMIADARREFETRPYTEEEAGRSGVHHPPTEEEAPTDLFAEPGKEPDVVADGDPKEESKGRLAEDAKESATEEPSGPPQEESLSPEEKVRRSMKLALELGPEIERKSDLLASLLPDDFPEKAPAFETEILDLLRRIAEPLQDPNQNQQNENQDQNQDQNQGQNRGQGQDQDQSQGQDQDQRNQNRQDRQNQQSEESQQDDRQMTPEEEEARRQEEKAESMMRKVRDRRRTVENQRKQRESLFRRYEKPEKDW